MLLIKYGPAIYGIVKEILSLIKWHRGTGSTFASVDLDGELKGILGRFRVTGDETELKAMLAKLKLHKNAMMMGL